MKKILLILFMMFGLLFLVSCGEKKGGQEPSVYKTVTEEEWNNNVKDYAFAKNEDTKLIIKVYSDPASNEPDFVLSKDGLVYKINTIASGNDFINYADFKNKVSYRYYGIDRVNYYKSDYDATIEETLGAIIENFSVDFSKVKYEKDHYVSTIPYEGKEKYGHYSFINGILREFDIYFEGELDYKVTIEPGNTNIVLPEVNRINEMSKDEMKVFLKETLRELKSYGAVAADYDVRSYEHYTIAEFEYLRIKSSDGTYKTIEQILDGVKSNLVNSFFGNRVGIIGQEESLDELMWFGMLESGNQDGLVIKLIPHDNKVDVVFAVVDYDVLNIITLKENLENRFVVDPEEDVFWFDGTAMIDTKDCLLIQYESEMEGEFETVVSFVKTCLEDNGYEFAQSGSTADYHYEVYEFDNKAIKVHFTSDEENVQQLKITFCVSFGDDEAYAIVERGVESPLFDYFYIRDND